MVLCLVFSCSKRSGIDKDVSFYRIPEVITNRGKDLEKLSGKCHSGFLSAIRRADLTEINSSLPRGSTFLAELGTLDVTDVRAPLSSLTLGSCDCSVGPWIGSCKPHDSYLWSRARHMTRRPQSHDIM